MESIRDTIDKSGRLNDICWILHDIYKKTDIDLPVRCQYDSKSNVVTRVKVDAVKKGIMEWYSLIHTTGEYVPNSSKESLEALLMLVDSILDMKLHNYANSCAHRVLVDKEDLEDIRAYSVLKSSLDALFYQFFDDETGEFIPFSIPDGWKVQTA